MDGTKNSKEIKKPTHLYLQDKFLKAIPTLGSCENLSVLYLHNNSIEKIENLQAATGLTSLYLQNNKIAKIENLSELKKLNKLFLGHNRISVVENLEALSNLKELHLEKQFLNSGETLCFDPRTIFSIAKNLQVLNISYNGLTEIQNLSPFKYLHTFLAAHNKLPNIDDILNTIKHWYYLYQASFIGNPVVKKHKYRESIIGTTVRLELLDNKQISETTRCFIQRLQQEKLNKSQQSINLASIRKDLPNNYPLALQKAASKSMLKNSLSVKNLCTDEDSKGYLPWKALTQSHSAKRSDKKSGGKRKEAPPLGNFL